MKRGLALILVAVLLLGMVAMIANAKDVSNNEQPDEVILTIGALEEGELDGVVVGEYAEDGQLESIAVEETAEESSGFWGWLSNLWKQILSLFGL